MKFSGLFSILLLTIFSIFPVNEAMPKAPLREYTQDEVSVLGDSYYENETNMLADGVVKSFYDDGKLKREERVRNGKLNGSSKMYYPSGELLLNIYFQDNKPSGSYKIFYPNGETKVSGNYSVGRPSGIFKKYDEEGEIVMSITFNNGKIKQGIRYSDGEASVIPIEELSEAVSTLLH